MFRSWSSIVLLVLIVAFPLCFMWQGLDVTDTGYYAVNCQQFFHGYPDDFGDAQTTAYWLTNFIGASWYQLTGGCGVIGFRMLFVLLVYLTLAVVWLATKAFSRTLALSGLLVAEVLCVGQDIYVPAYNQVSSLFFAASAVALYFGLTRRNALLTFAGGAIAGASIFARIVNAPIGMLVLAVWYFHILRQSGTPGTLWKSLKASLREASSFISGFVLGIVAVVGLIAAIGHLGAFRAMFGGLFGMSAGPKTGYGPIVLLKKFAWDYINAGLLALGFMAVAWFVGKPIARIQSAAFRAFGILAAAAVAIFLLLYFPLLNIWAMPAMLNVILLAAVCGFLNVSRDLRVLCLIAAIVLFVTPLGSADGMCNSFHGMFLAIPVALLALLTAKAERPAASPVASSALVEKCSRAVAAVASYTSTKLDPRCVGWFCALVIVGFSLGYRAHFTYRDSTHRSAMRVQVDHPKLRGVFTTASRAHALDELLQHLKPLVQKDDYLFDHMQLPLIYFLTDTRPYLFTSWPNLYQPPQFQAALKRAESTRAALPVCIMTKIDTCHPGWPDETFPPFQTYRFVENRRTVESFLQEHRYQKIWENNAFEIWKTTETKSGTLASHDSSK